MPRTDPAISTLRRRIADQRVQIANIDRHIAGLKEARERRLKNLQRLHAQLAQSEPADAQTPNA